MIIPPAPTTDATLARILCCGPLCGRPDPAQHGPCAAATYGGKRLAALRAAGFNVVPSGCGPRLRFLQAQRILLLEIEVRRLRRFVREVVQNPPIFNMVHSRNAQALLATPIAEVSDG